MFYIPYSDLLDNKTSSHLSPVSSILPPGTLRLRLFAHIHGSAFPPSMFSCSSTCIQSLIYDVRWFQFNTLLPLYTVYIFSQPNRIRKSQTTNNPLLENSVQTRIVCRPKPARRQCAKEVNPFTTGNPFLGTKLLGFSLGRGSGAQQGITTIHITHPCRTALFQFRAEHNYYSELYLLVV